MDSFDIDFLDVGSPKSGDAILLRYTVNNVTHHHVVDAGYQQTGELMAQFIRARYGQVFINHVVATHNDGDHAGGLRTILEQFDVGALWMLRPWIYADVLLPHFPTYNSAQRLEQRLRAVYPNLAAIEEIALGHNIPIHAPFQGQWIGYFRVLAPTPARYGRLILASEKTPETTAAVGLLARVGTLITETMDRVRPWGYEVFSADETSAENEMSIVQFAQIAGRKILLTADAGREALTEAAVFAPQAGLILPGIDFFQVPHHGSRKNVSTALLNHWLGPILPQKLPTGQELFNAMISSSKPDTDHPRKAVLRAMHHRGACIGMTEGKNSWWSWNAPLRGDYTAFAEVPYPEAEEE